MRINFNIGQQNNFLNTVRINHNIAQKNEKSGLSTKENNMRRDIVKISPKKDTNSIIENLMKQKTMIYEQKNSLISSTLKDGGTMDSIKSQLDAYEEQLKNIDKQISEIIAQETEKQTEKTEKQDDNKPKTKEEIQNEKMVNIADISTDLDKIQVVHSAKSKVDGDIRVLNMEIKLDKMNSASTEAKEAKVSELSKKSSELASSVADDLISLSEEIKDENESQDIVYEDDKDKNINTYSDPDDDTNENNNEKLI